jgi:mRNA-degrading endonuclease RelE of RelBE toxin-antitoxin system
MEFIEAPAFTRRVSDYLSDDEYQELQNLLAANPELGVLMPRTGGFRKLRWTHPRRGKGRRGGLRIIYYFFMADQQIWLMTIYDKDEASDLTPKQKQALKSAVETELQAREATKLAGKQRSRRTQQ